MKRFGILVAMIIAICFSTFAQDEWALPSYNTEIVRKASILLLEDTKYENVKITMVSSKSYENDYVKVYITNSKGVRIYSKIMKNSLLYIFPSGTINIGKRNFIKVLVAKYEDETYAIIKEQEGIYN